VESRGKGAGEAVVRADADFGMVNSTRSRVGCGCNGAQRFLVMSDN
jgi:hypothetical protein